MSAARMESRVEHLENLVKDIPEIKKDIASLKVSMTILVQQMKEYNLQIQALTTDVALQSSGSLDLIGSINKAAPEVEVQPQEQKSDPQKHELPASGRGSNPSSCVVVNDLLVKTGDDMEDNSSASMAKEGKKVEVFDGGVEVDVLEQASKVTMMVDGLGKWLVLTVEDLERRKKTREYWALKDIKLQEPQIINVGIILMNGDSLLLSNQWVMFDPGIRTCFEEQWAMTKRRSNVKDKISRVYVFINDEQDHDTCILDTKLGNCLSTRRPTPIVFASPFPNLESPKQVIYPSLLFSWLSALNTAEWEQILMGSLSVITFNSLQPMYLLTIASMIAFFFVPSHDLVIAHIDGDTNPNNTVITWVIGLTSSSLISSIYCIETMQLQACLVAVMQGFVKSIVWVAKLMAWVGEGVKCLIKVTVIGAKSGNEVAEIVRLMAYSSLVKAAVYGKNSKWGLIVAVAGYAKIPFNQNHIYIKLGDFFLMDKWQPIVFDKWAENNHLKKADIIFEESLAFNKDGVGLLMTVSLWVIQNNRAPLTDIVVLKLKNASTEVSEIVFFLLVVMTIVEIVDVHQGFKLVSDNITTRKPRTLLWVVDFVTFTLSSILDNLTTTIILVFILRKLAPPSANDGGAWMPIGDVTTTRLWIHGQKSTLQTMKDVIILSVVSLAVPLAFMSLTSEVNGKETRVSQCFGIIVLSLVIINWHPP